MSSQVEQQGFALIEGVLTPKQVASFVRTLTEVSAAMPLERSGSVFAVRNLLNVPEIRKLAGFNAIRELVMAELGSECFPVRGILFDKVPDANWKVPWHQDVTIAVKEKIETPEFASWTMKAGVQHVQPPVAVLENMLSVRLHLDVCTADNGALRVLPGTHQRGRIPESSITAIRAEVQAQTCESEVGGALLMRPLLLHASSPSASPRHRRVIHLDYASCDLPNGLQWAERADIF